MPRTPSNVPLENRAPGFAGGFLRFRLATRFGSILSGFFRSQQNRVYLKTVNTPKQRVFSTCWAPFFLAIRRVFLQKMASSGGKSLAVGHIPGFQIDPNVKY